MKRQLIMDALEARFKTILISNGFTSDLGLNVTPWRTDAFDEAELPAMTFRDQDSDTVKPSGAIHQHTVTIATEIYVAKGKTTAAEARRMIADVSQAIGKDIYFGKLAIRTMPGTSKIELEQDKLVIGKITMTLQIIYVTPEWEI